jgi:hypothetical protein
VVCCGWWRITKRHDMLNWRKKRRIWWSSRRWWVMDSVEGLQLFWFLEKIGAGRKEFGLLLLLWSCVFDGGWKRFRGWLAIFWGCWGAKATIGYSIMGINNSWGKI